MKLFDAGMILILLTTFNNFLAGDCFNCFTNCEFYYEQYRYGEGSSGDCSSERDSAPCNGSCFGDYETTSLEKHYSRFRDLKAVIHMGCSPQKYPDSCVPTTSDKNKGVTQRCYCNSDTCFHFEHHGIVNSYVKDFVSVDVTTETEGETTETQGIF